MEHAATPKLFRNHATRGWFVNGVIDAIESCETHVELIFMYRFFEGYFEKMRNSLEEYDSFSMALIEARYQAMHLRIEESRDWVRRLAEEYEESQLKLLGE